MSCSEFADSMQRDLDGDLTEEEQAVLRDHLATCEACANEYALLRKLSFELERLPKVDLPYSLVDQIAPQLERESVADAPAFSSRQARRRKWSLLAGGLAAAAILSVMAQRMFPSGYEHYGAPMDRSVQQQSERSAESDRLKEVDERRFVREQERPLAKADAPPVDRRENSAATSPSTAERETLPQMDSANSSDAREEPPTAPDSDEEKETLSTEESFLTAKEPEESLTTLAERPAETDASAADLAPETEIMLSRLLFAPIVEEHLSEYPSPSGTWTAKMEQNRLIVLDQEGKEAYRGRPWDERVQVSVEWLDDNRLRYRLRSIDSDPSEEAWIIDLKEKVERRQ